MAHNVRCEAFVVCDGMSEAVGYCLRNVSYFARPIGWETLRLAVSIRYSEVQIASHINSPESRLASGCSTRNHRIHRIAWLPHKWWQVPERTSPCHASDTCGGDTR